MRRGAALVAIAAALAGCGDGQPSAPTAADIHAIDVSPDHTITVTERGYEPAHLELEGGEVVQFVNGGDQPHSFTADDQRFDTRMQPGDDTTVVLTEPGEVTFHDVEAPDHEGTLTVVAPG